MTITCKPVFYIIPGDTGFNRGDQCNLKSQIDLISEAFPGAKIYFDSSNIKRDLSWYKNKSAKLIPVERRLLFIIGLNQIKAFYRSDIIIWGGGALVTDHGCKLLIPYWIFLLFIAHKIFKKPIIAWSHGVTLKTFLGKQLAKLAYKMAAIICVRDKSSLAAVRNLGLNKAQLSADVAVLIKSRLATSPQHKKHGVVIVPTFWPFYHSSDNFLPYIFRKKIAFGSTTKPNNVDLLTKYKTSLACLAMEISQALSTSVTFIPHYGDPKYPDSCNIDDIITSTRANSYFNNKISYNNLYKVSPEDYLVELSKFKAIVSVTLHHSICASSLGLPVVQLVYEQKCEEFMDSLGVRDRCFDWMSISDIEVRRNIIAHLASDLENPNKYQEQIQKPFAILKEKAQKNIESVKEILEQNVCKTI